jgi:hypothetical protein
VSPSPRAGGTAPIRRKDSQCLDEAGKEVLGLQA